MKVALRHYQTAAIEAIRKAIRAKVRHDGTVVAGRGMHIMLQLPTGAGKTLTGAAMLAGALERGNRSLFAAHRLELIDQTVKTFARLEIFTVGVVRANDKRADSSQPIQVCSIQTLQRRAPLENVQIVFIDEAHRSCAASYRKHLFEAYPQAIFVGLSATPCRTDGKPLGEDWDVMVHGATYSLLIEEGHIVAPIVVSTPVLPDMAAVRTVAGDYNAEDLEKAVNKSTLIGNSLAEWQKWSGGRRTVAFAVSVAHSLAIVEMFRAAGVAAEHLDGTTPETERKAILARIEAGTTTLVSNVGVLCEGWDCPPVKCLLLMRPTKSLALYMQMSGRILRPWQDVTPIILDHGGNVDRTVHGEPMGLPHQDREWSLEGRPKKVGTMPLKCCGHCFAMVMAALMVCPHCGTEFPKPVSPEPPEPKEELTHVELVLRTLGGEDAKLSFFRATVKEAQRKRRKPGWVLHSFREEFGEMPPRKWWNALVRDAKADPEWAARAFESVPEAWQ